MAKIKVFVDLDDTLIDPIIIDEELKREQEPHMREGQKKGMV
ncbi:MAG: hypothetical protein ABH810_02940 [bacterium]